MFSLNTRLYHTATLHAFAPQQWQSFMLKFCYQLLFALSITIKITIFHEKKCSLGLAAAMQLGRAPRPIRAAAHYPNASGKWYGYFYA
jgi:hypothetical protein